MNAIYQRQNLTKNTTDDDQTIVVIPILKR